MRRTAVLLALVGALAPACKGADNTKIVVAVWSDLAVPDDLDSVRIEVTGTGSKTFPLTAASPSGQATLVAKLELVPLGAKNENFTVTATGLRSGNEVVAQTASVSFVAGQSLLLKLFFYGNCKGLTCPEKYTCAAGACDQPIAVPNLPAYDPSVPLSPPDAGTTLDSSGGAIDSGGGGAGGSGGSAGGSGGAVASGGVVATGGIVGTGGAGGSAGGSGGTVASGGVVASGGIDVVRPDGGPVVRLDGGPVVRLDGGPVASGGVVATGGIVRTGGGGMGGTVGTGDWAGWPMPNDQVDVTAGAPNLESYTDNKDGTVTDNLTGLMWQQTVPTGTYTWSQAVAYCPTLNLAGHSDWHLPSRIELVSIVDLGVSSGPMINSTYFPSTPAYWFWSASPVAGSPSSAWSVAFFFGYTHDVDFTLTYNVRCVR
jgi:hypothetical protein